METAIDLQLLVCFASVAEHASFSKAATSLGLAKGTVSRSIARLEELLGVELLHRTTHHVALGTAGAALYERTRAHLAALRSAVADLPERDEEPSGLLRITAPHDVGTVILPAVLGAFARRVGAVRFDVRLTGANVDVVKEGYDLAIRAVTKPLKDSSLTVRRLGRHSAAFYASPSYLARRGRPKHLDDAQTWILHPAVIRYLEHDPESVQMIVDDFFLVRDLVRDGVGVGVLPGFVARSYVREGLIEEVAVASPKLFSGELVLLYPSRGRTPKKVVAFRDLLVEALRHGA
ncbi:MAG: LysR family transcriptional regulator [Deltaproteobacteria bacterium]|nr:LysR family transcriptional regulator [Deltaproteobacteria bacterium]